MHVKFRGFEIQNGILIWNFPAGFAIFILFTYAKIIRYPNK